MIKAEILLQMQLFAEQVYFSIRNFARMSCICDM